MDLPAWIALASVCLLGAMTPGASLLVVSQHAIAGGRPGGLAAAWAHAAGVGFWALIGVFGLALALQSHTLLARGLQLAAGAYLLWLAWQSWWAGSNGCADDTVAAPAGAAARDGLLISLFNPKVGLFFLAIFTPLLAADSSLAVRVSAAGLAALIDGLWYSVVTLIITHAPWRPRLAQTLQRITRVTALVFLGFAVLAIFAALR